jgi:hypothetical protein
MQGRRIELVYLQYLTELFEPLASVLTSAVRALSSSLYRLLACPLPAYRSDYLLWKLEYAASCPEMALYKQ